MGVKPFEGKSNAKSRLLCVDTCSGSICRGCSIYRLFKRLIQATDSHHLLDVHS